MNMPLSLPFPFPSPADVLLRGLNALLRREPWACERLAKLSDQQWNDAFRSARYNDEQTRRYTHKIKEKIAQGLQLTGAAN